MSWHDKYESTETELGYYMPSLKKHIASLRENYSKELQCELETGRLVVLDRTSRARIQKERLSKAFENASKNAREVLEAQDARRRDPTFFLVPSKFLRFCRPVIVRLPSQPTNSLCTRPQILP